MERSAIPMVAAAENGKATDAFFRAADAKIASLSSDK